MSTKASDTPPKVESGVLQVLSDAYCAGIPRDGSRLTENGKRWLGSSAVRTLDERNVSLPGPPGHNVHVGPRRTYLPTQVSTMACIHPAPLTAAVFDRAEA